MTRGPSNVRVDLTMAEAAAIVDELFPDDPSHLADINDSLHPDDLLDAVGDKIRRQLHWVQQARRP